MLRGRTVTGFLNENRKSLKDFLFNSLAGREEEKKKNPRHKYVVYLLVAAVLRRR